MRNGIRLGRIAGIEVTADWSVLIIFALIAFGLATGVFPAWHPDWPAALAWGTALGAATLFLASVLVHELSHALIGLLGGIQVRRITLFMLGGMAHMEHEPPTWRSELAMAAIGPVTSLALGLVFLWLAGFVAGPLDIDPENPREALASLSPLATLLLWLGPVNILLGVFNLVPGFPLDGGRVLRALLWGATGSLRKATRWGVLRRSGLRLAAHRHGGAHAVRLPLPGAGRRPVRRPVADVHRLVPQQRRAGELPAVAGEADAGGGAGRADHADAARPRGSGAFRGAAGGGAHDGERPARAAGRARGAFPRPRVAHRPAEVRATRVGTG